MTASYYIYSLSLHDALPISIMLHQPGDVFPIDDVDVGPLLQGDRKSTRLNSSHVKISYAVFCLKKKIDLTLVILQLLSDIRVLCGCDVVNTSAMSDEDVVGE